MSKEIIINAEKDQARIAIVEDGELAELHFEDPDNERTIGDIYLGRVQRIMHSIRAAFVDIGQKQDAFLHFSDLADNLPDLLAFVDDEKPDASRFARRAEAQDSSAGRPPRSHEGESPEQAEHRHRVPDAKTRGRRRSAQRRSKQQQGEQRRERRPEEEARLETFLKRDQRILVKITKEPISNKGSRVSTNISLPGRFLVLVPLADYIAVSKKIVSHKERRRLRALAKSLLPEGFGVIVRTVAAGRDAKALDTDLRLLLEKWRKLENRLAGRPEPPLKAHEDVNMASSIMRDLFSQDYDRVYVDDPRLHRKIKSYVQAVAPQMAPAVKLYKGKNIFQEVGVARDLEEVFESRIDLPSGGYLFIEQTEAMHVVDVNSGRSGRGMSQEENSLKVDLEAARIIAKQIRLRDLGGIIVVDFIDLRSDRNRKKVYDELRKEFSRDRAVTKVLPMSDFGLVQITRQRLRPSLTKTYSADFLNGTPGSDDPAQPERASGVQRKQPKERPSQEKKPQQKPLRQQQDSLEEAPAPGARPSEEPKRRDGAGPAGPAASTVSPEALLQEMEQWIATYRTNGARRTVVLRVHPFTAAYLNRRVPNYPTRWFMRYLVRVRLEASERQAPMSYAFLDARSGEDITDAARRQSEPHAA